MSIIGHPSDYSDKAPALPWPPEEVTNIHADIDGDIVAYKIAYVAENETLNEAQSLANNILKSIVRGVKGDSWTVHLTDRDNSVNFRTSLATIQPYKGGRSTVKPKWLDHIRSYMVEYWEGIIHSGIEADDAMSISHYVSQPTYPHTDWMQDSCWSPLHPDKQHILCTTDKDLKGVSGAVLYNWDKDETIVQSPIDAAAWFYTQCLMGDPVDNIKGLSLTLEESSIFGGDWETAGDRLGPPSIGPRSSWVREVELSQTPQEMENVVLAAYRERHQDLVYQQEYLTPPLLQMLKLGPELSLKENAQLLWMLEYPGQEWNLFNVS